jgi:hypothetical protein|tara:strand:+ start:146 stop:265 length:120 start_codon:yes stop_codon:yes gene_type:complete
VVELVEQDKTDNLVQMVEMVEQGQINHQYIQEQLLEYVE